MGGDLIVDERPLYREVLATNRAIASAEGYDDVLRLVVDKTAAFTGATACMLVLAQQDGLARIVRSVGIDPVTAAGLAVPLTEGIDRELCRLLGCESPDQFVGVPVIGKDGLLGILGIYWEGARALEGAPSDELLSAVADQAAIALDNIERGHRLRASAQALEISKERFRNLVEATSDWLWEIDENGVYAYVSPQVRQLLGYEPEEVLGRTPFDLMPPEEVQQVAEVFAAIVARRSPISSLENTNRHRDGHLVVLETSGIPLFDDAGRFRGYRGIDRDITQRKRAEQALRASEAKLAGIISVAADAIVSVDEAQRIIMFNHGAEKIFGWSQDEVLGKPLELLMPERFRGLHRQHVTGFNSGPDLGIKIEQGRRAIVGLRKSGEEFPADAAVSRLHDGGGWINTIVLRDITQQKRVEYEELFLAEVGAVLAQTLDSETTLTSVAQLAMRDIADFCTIDFVDERGEFRRTKAVGTDPAKAALYEALKQFPFDRSHPLPSWPILRSQQPQLVAEISADLIRALAQSEEHRRLLEALALTSIMGVPLNAHGRLLGALMVGSCRPERSYGPGDLKLLTELGQRAALALDNARLYRTTQRALQTRDDVLGVVAHDLRNPLGTIMLQASLLRRLEPELGPRAGKLADVIERASRRMNRLIQDLLDTTRMETGSLPINPARVPAAQIVLGSEEAHKAVLASGSLQLRVELPPELPDVWGDRDRLFQVFENLLGNAAKFTPAGGRITVGARPGEKEIVFWVADTGEGIAAADVPRVFDRFWQARKGEHHGAGLGLAIAKGIVEAHGGRIWVDSAPGQGSTFAFTVPMAPPVDDNH